MRANTGQRYHSPSRPRIEIWAGNTPGAPAQAFMLKRGNVQTFICLNDSVSALRRYLKTEFPDHSISG